MEYLILSSLCNEEIQERDDGTQVKSNGAQNWISRQSDSIDADKTRQKERKKESDREREIEADRDREKDEKKREMCALTHYAKRPLLNRKCCIFLCPLRRDSVYDETTNLHRNLSGTRDLNWQGKSQYFFSGL